MSATGPRMGQDLRRPQQRGAEGRGLAAIGRAFGGALVFALPMLMTMEMWWLGFSIGPWRLCLLTALLLPVLVGVSHFAGLEETFGWREDLRDAFVAYAVVWSAIYLGFKKHDYLATAAAVAAFTAILAAVLGGRRAWLQVWLVATAAHAAGYWLGGVVCYGAFDHDTRGMLAWGVGYGLGFGAGIGYAFHVFQRRPLPPGA